MLARLQAMQEKHRIIGDVRGKGLLLGLELVKDRKSKELVSKDFTKALFQECLRRGLLAMFYTPVIRLNPPLNIPEDPPSRASTSSTRRSARWRGNGSSSSLGLMLKGALIGAGHVAVNGHLPGVAGARRRRHRRRRRRPARPARGLRRGVPERPLVRDGRGAARDRDARLRRHLHAARVARGALARAALDRSLHVLCEKPLVLSPEELRGLPALAAEKERTLFTVHNWKHAPVLAADRRARAFGRARRGPPLPLGDAARQARRRGRRRRQLARRPGPVGRRDPRRPRLARALRPAGLDADDAAHGRGAPLDPQAPRVADRGHGGPDALPPHGLRRDLPDVGRRRARQPRRAHGHAGASSSSTAAASRSTTSTARRPSRSGPSRR